MTPTASTAVIRQWARSQGHAVGDRGRLSPQVLAAYASSNGETAPSPTSQPQPQPQPQKVTANPTHTAPPAHRGVRVQVRPAPGATGTGRRIAARTT